MLLFLSKHSRPHLANVTRKLSMADDVANPAAFQELLQVMKYILKIKNLGLKLEPTGNASKPWDIDCLVTFIMQEMP